MSARVLIAGVGNIFFGDDGFGCEVVRLLQSERFADVKAKDVKIEDFGIAGMHLSFELLAGYERAIIVDLAARGGLPGTLYIIEPDLGEAGPPPDPHRMDLLNVFAFVRTLGGAPPPIVVVGCEPQTTDEGIGLSEPVTAALEPATELVCKLIARALAAPSRREGETTWLEA
jgi:hydrogenase maturation protease